ncbi:DUF3558 family protein [Saccharothrix variisporea]|uniref:Uncharacterized protein DUF3558 n=1 Tax=Saccharothrix variisporea TaxID=543527 RepID=A0A495XJB6_9PSEU|nr:DUF3558 family protein [Saccharothrix variisporea]RKT73779.1 uncharacterized protein DUF3558 [Saccharothrix variisporea]
MNSRIVLTSLAAAALVVMTACTASTSGDAKPAPDTGGSTSSKDTGSSTSSSTSTKASGSLADTDPCSLLSRSEAERVVGPLKEEPKPEKIGSSRGCAFTPDRASLSVGIRANVGLSALLPNGGEIKDITVGQHQARQLLDATGSCGIYLGVTSSSRVEVVLNTATSNDPCTPALRIAELVEPKLP